MNFQEYLENKIAVNRQERLKNSPQLTLNELILKLSAIPNQESLLGFDFDGYVTDHLMSWRGSYDELALDYKAEPTGIKVCALLLRLRKAFGETFVGYKGGDYIMGKHTPIWVSHYGEVDHRAVVDVKTNLDGKVVIETQELEY